MAHSMRPPPSPSPPNPVSLTSLIEASIVRAASGDPSIARAATASLFTEVVEALADTYRPADRDQLVRVIARLVTVLRDNLEGSRREDRQRLDSRLREFGCANEGALIQAALAAVLPRRFEGDPEAVAKVVVLSRVTVGADILLSSVLLQAASDFFPQAERVFVGPAKNSRLFAAARGLRLRALDFRRRGLAEDRVLSWLELSDLLAEERRSAGGRTLVLNPDSRLLQSAVLPAGSRDTWDDCFSWDPSRRDSGADASLSLAGHLQRWLAASFGDSGKLPLPFVAPSADCRQRAQRWLADTFRSPRPRVAVSLGFGGNPQKRVWGLQDRGASSVFEKMLLCSVLEAGFDVVLDCGFGSVELLQARALIDAIRGRGWRVRETNEESSAEASEDAGARGEPMRGNGPGYEEGRRPPNDAAGVLAVQCPLDTAAALIGDCDASLSYDSQAQHVAAAQGKPVISIHRGATDSLFPERWRPVGVASVEVISAGSEAMTSPEQTKLVEQVLSRLCRVLEGSR